MDGMQLHFGSNHGATTYVQNTKITHKQRFASARADKYLHLGSKNTSRVKGANAVLKLYNNHSSLGDLQTVHENATLAIKNQAMESQVQHLSEQNRILHFSKKPMYVELVGNISHFALKQIQEQIG